MEQEDTRKRLPDHVRVILDEHAQRIRRGAFRSIDLGPYINELRKYDRKFKGIGPYLRAAKKVDH